MTSVHSYWSVHVFGSTSTWMMSCSVVTVLGRGWSRKEVVPNLSFLSWWSLIRVGSFALGGGGFFSHLRCHCTMWGSLAGFIHSLSRFVTVRCILVRLCPMFPWWLRCWTRSEIGGWRNRVVVFSSQSSKSLCISSSPSSRGNPASVVVTHIFLTDRSC